jgi:hypothetical protein
MGQARVYGHDFYWQVGYPYLTIDGSLHITLPAPVKNDHPDTAENDKWNGLSLVLDPKGIDGAHRTGKFRICCDGGKMEDFSTWNLRWFNMENKKPQFMLETGVIPWVKPKVISFTFGRLKPERRVYRVKEGDQHVDKPLSNLL